MTDDLFDWKPPQKYPAVPGHVRGSETSKDAAKWVEPNAKSMRSLIWRYAADRDHSGIICDEVEVEFAMKHQTASARIRELELSGDLLKTSRKRATRSGSTAFVYIAIRKET